MKNSESQIKSSGESLTNRLNQVEEKMSGLEDKVKELDQSVGPNIK